MARDEAAASADHVGAGKADVPALGRGPIARLSLLGGCQLADEAQNDRTPATRKARAILAYLSLTPRGSVSRERLADLLWGARFGNNARTSLRQALKELRLAMGGLAAHLLIADRERVGIRQDLLVLDVHELERAARLAQHSAADIGRLYQGELMEGLGTLNCDFDDWLVAQRERYRTLAVEALERVLEDGEHDRSLGLEHVHEAANAVLAIDPAHEAGHRALMRLHAERGNLAGAQRQYDVCVEALRRLVEAPPSAVTKRLMDELRRAVPVPADPSSLRPTPSPRTSRSASPAMAQPLLVVEPFIDEAGAAIGGEFAGLSDHLLSALARFRWVSIGADDGIGEGRNGASHARYALSGTVRRSASPADVTVRLVDRSTGHTLVVERPAMGAAGNRSPIEVIVTSVAARIISQLLVGETRRARQQAKLDTASDHVFRALPAFYELDVERLKLAYRHFQRAIELEPFNVQAHCWLTLWYISQLRPCEPDARSSSMAAAVQHGRLAAEYDPQDSLALASYAHAQSLNREHDLSLLLIDRALAANPLDPGTHARVGIVLAMAGEQERGIAAFERYLELDPLDPFRRYFAGAYSMCCLLAGRLEDALAIGREAAAGRPQLGFGYRSTIAALGHLGRYDEARPLIRRYLEIEPTFNVQQYVNTFPLRRKEDRQHLADGLYRAGMH